MTYLIYHDNFPTLIQTTPHTNLLSIIIKLEHCGEICIVECENELVLCKELPMIFQKDNMSFHIRHTTSSNINYNCYI